MSAFQIRTLPISAPAQTYLPSDERVDAVALTPDGRWLATGGNVGRVMVYRTPSTELKTVIAAHQARQHETNHVYAMERVAIDPIGNRVASLGIGGKLKVWNAAKGTLERETACAANSSLCFNADGSQLLFQPDRSRCVETDAATGAELRTFPVIRNVRALAYSREGAAIAAGDAAGQLSIWNNARRAIALCVQAHGSAVAHCEFSKDGKRFLTSGLDNIVKLWNTATGQEIIGWTGARAAFMDGDEKLVIWRVEHFYLHDSRSMKSELRIELLAEDLLDLLCERRPAGLTVAWLREEIARSTAAPSVQAAALRLAPLYLSPRP